MINKKIILILILCCFFLVGTFSFVGTVEATKWKKIDSGKFETEYPPAEYKNLVYYQTFTKGENKLYYETYFFPKNGSAKKLANRVTLTKNKNVITEKSKDYFSNEIEINSIKTKLSVKKYYNNSMKSIIKFNTTPPDKLTFDEQYFTVNNTRFEFYYSFYGIKPQKNYIIAYIYEDEQEYCTFKIYKKDKKIIYKEYNEKRKLTLRETYKTTKTIKSIYKTKKNELIKKIKIINPNEVIKELIGENKAIKIANKEYNITNIRSIDLEKDLYYGNIFVWKIYAKTEFYSVYLAIDASTGKIVDDINYGGGVFPSENK